MLNTSYLGCFLTIFGYVMTRPLINISKNTIVFYTMYVCIYIYIEILKDMGH